MFTQITVHLRADVLEQIIEMVDVDINNHSLSDLHNDFLHVLSVIVKVNIC